MDFTADQFHTLRPAPQMLPRLYGLLGEVFEPDRPLMECVLDGSVSLNHWEHFVACRASLSAASQTPGDIVAHAALVHMRIWFKRRIVPIAGIASVFTLAPYRRIGLARRVVIEALTAADRAGEPCVLFTSLPHVYEGLGFRVIDQGYRRAPAATPGLRDHSHRFTRVARLGAPEMERLRRIYTQSPPDDGKLERDPAIWPFYQAAFNGRSDVCAVFCDQGRETLGYMRLEREDCALLISEMGAPSDAAEVVESLLAHAFAAARSQELPFVALALPETHAAWAVLAARGITTEPDTTASREHFMVRLPAADTPLSRLRWSLADKF